MSKWIWFDMDGTIADFYGVKNWLEYLINESAYPYKAAKPLLNFSAFSRILNKLQNKGYKIGIISWASKAGSYEFNLAVETAKRAWLVKHLPAVEWNIIKVVPYGTNKQAECKEGILFDDEERNRNDWAGNSYPPQDIMKILKGL